MNVRVIIAVICVAGAGLALAWPTGAVRVAAVMLAAVTGAILLDGLLRALDGIDPLRTERRFAAVRAVQPVGPQEMTEFRREIEASPTNQPMSDLVFARVQLVARQRVRSRLGLDPASASDHAALAARLPPRLFTLVMSGLVADPTRTPGDALLRGYVPHALRPPMSALPQLLEEMESL